MENLLTKDGVVEYHGKVMVAERADHFMARMMEEIEWRNDEAFIMGKHFITKRKVAWYGGKPFEYAYSGTVKKALPWTPALMELKLLAEQHSGDSYNSCLLNLYHDGNEGMAWHSDGEKDLKRDGAIASLSFGAERKFCFKHKGDGEKIDIWLEHGSLLVMKGATQRFWLHRLPPTKKINSPRVNLTFRTIVD
jgi:alkylated DNA repair dioxygenase AlkB